MIESAVLVIIVRRSSSGQDAQISVPYNVSPLGKERYGKEAVSNSE
jgi:hypothetical protein